MADERQQLDAEEADGAGGHAQRASAWTPSSGARNTAAAMIETL